MSDFQELATALRAARAKATPGEWRQTGALGEFISDLNFMQVCRVADTVSLGSDGKTRSDGCGSFRPNRDFILTAANTLTAALDAAEAEIAELKAALQDAKDLYEANHG